MKDEKEKKELTLYKQENYEDYDIPEEQIDEIKKVNINFKSKVFYVLLFISIIIVLIFLISLPKIIKNAHNKKIAASYEEIVKNEGLGEIEIIDSTENSNEINEVKFFLGNSNGNLIQNASNNSYENGKIAYDDKYVYCVYEKDGTSGISIIEKETGNIVKQKDLMQGYDIYNLSKINDNLIFNAMGASSQGVQGSYVIFYDLKTESLSYINNLFNKGFIHIISSMNVTSKGLYMTCVGSDELTFLDFKTNEIKTICKFTSNALTDLAVFPRVLDVTEDGTVFTMDSSGISKIDIDSGNRITLAPMISIPSFSPVIYKNDVYYAKGNIIFKNGEIFCAVKKDVPTINICNDTLFFAQGNEIYYIKDINNNTHSELFETLKTNVNSIYVAGDYIVVNPENPIILSLNKN